MTAASESIRNTSKISFFAYPGAEQDLNQIATHSQGQVRGTRKDIFEKEELTRIKTYTGQSIEPIQDIIRYMQRRKTYF